MGKLDFVIFNESNIKEKNVNLTRIRSLKQGFVYNSEYYEDNIYTLKDLNNYPLILQKDGSNSRQFLNQYMKNKNIELSPTMEVVSQELVTEFINIGLGIGFVIIDLAKRNYPKLKELKINKQIPKLNIYLATNKYISLTFASKTFIKEIKNYD
jgi:DNA-binding transcriptional LysR family regulator